VRRLRACVIACAVLAARNTQAQEPPTANDVSVALAEGRYDSAESGARALVRVTGDGGATAAYAEATDLLVEALWRNGRLTEAQGLAAQAVDLRTKLHLSTSPALRNLARVAQLAGEPARAIALLKRVPESEGTLLDDLVSAFTAATRYADAGEAIERIRRQRAVELPDERALALDLEVEGTLLQAQGEYAKSGPLLDRALATTEAHRPDHPDVARLLGLVGDQRWFEGDLQAAYEAYIRSLALAERVLRADHPTLALYLRNLAFAVHQRGDVRGGLALRQRALALAQRSLGANHREVALQLNDLAMSEVALGDYTAALVHYERALEITRRHTGEIDPEVATYTYNLALSYARLRDVDESLRLLNRAISAWQRTKGAAHPFVGLAWATLGSTFLEFDLPQQALAALTRGLAVQERALGPLHRDVAQTTMDMARALLALHDTAGANALAARALTLWTAAGEEAGRAEAASIRGDVLAALGRDDEARALYAESLVASRRVYGATNPVAIRVQLKLANIEARLGHGDAAFDEALEVEAFGREHLGLILRSLPERMAVSYADARPNGLHLALSLASSVPTSESTTQRLFDAVIRARAVVLDEIVARRRAVISENDEAAGELWNSLTTARERLAFLAVAGPGSRSPAQYASFVNDARRQKELAERALAARSATFSAELAKSNAGFDQVRAALPPRTGLVSYTRYLKQPEGRAAYLAFVVTTATAARIVPLGDGEAIDTAVNSWHRIMALGAGRPGSESAYRAAGARLRQLIWDPLMGPLGSVDRVIVVPDAALNLVSLAALPIRDSSYLVEEGPVIHYVASERDIVRSAPAQGTGLLAMGGASFDSLVSTGRPQARRGGLESCMTLASLRFEPLAATAREVSDVASQWLSGNATVLTGASATERAFKERAPGSRVLHLATHGFFLPANCGAPMPQTRSVGGLVSVARAAPTALPLNAPLLLSGLALAGANRRGEARGNDDDGILTAEEVAALNLESVEWAVLSACDTGRGEIQNGEGVFGLRRAFQVAGVHTVIMSLWSVEDNATRAWMQRLYEARMRDGLDTADSVRRASLETLQARRASGESTHPFYWAAFVAAGDWR
jgi:CHAT domain-containing protein/tetratricopeptide (TPR) repeat protein